MVDDGPAIHYSAVPRGTPVYDADGNEIGTVDRVMDNYREHILDGFVIRMPKHGLRFVDAPEVARTAERGVTLTITAAEAESLPPPPDGGAVLPAEPRIRHARTPVRRPQAAVVGASGEWPGARGGRRRGSTRRPTRARAGLAR